MRKLKFRAWDKFHKTMDEVDGYYLYIADGELYEIFEETQGYETYMQKHIVTDKHEVMQYTGLRDSKGAEIYEGDIIRHRIKNMRTVVFKDGAFRTKRINYVAGELTDAFFFYENTGRDWEIIGNIYENPELLEV